MRTIFLSTTILVLSLATFAQQDREAKKVANIVADAFADRLASLDKRVPVSGI